MKKVLLFLFLLIFSQISTPANEDAAVMLETDTKPKLEYKQPYSSYVSGNIYSHPPNVLNVDKKVLIFESPLKKYFYVLQYKIRNISPEETLEINFERQSLTPERMLKLYERYEQQKHSKTTFKDPLDNLKTYAPAIGTVPLAELATVYSLASLPVELVKSGYNTVISPFTNNMSASDKELFEKEYESLQVIESKKITDFTLAPAEEIELFSLCDFQERYLPIVKVKFTSSDKTYSFKI